MSYPDAQVITPKSSMLPWILFALVFVGGVGAVLVEEQKLKPRRCARRRSTRSEEKARIELGEATSAKHALETRVQELQTENGRLTIKVAAAAHVIRRPRSARMRRRRRARSTTSTTEKARGEYGYGVGARGMRSVVRAFGGRRGPYAPPYGRRTGAAQLRAGILTSFGARSDASAKRSDDRPQPSALHRRVCERSSAV